MDKFTSLRQQYDVIDTLNQISSGSSIDGSWGGAFSYNGNGAPVYISGQNEKYMILIVSLNDDNQETTDNTPKDSNGFYYGRIVTPHNWNYWDKFNECTIWDKDDNLSIPCRVAHCDGLQKGDLLICQQMGITASFKSGAKDEDFGWPLFMGVLSGLPQSIIQVIATSSEDESDVIEPTFDCIWKIKRQLVNSDVGSNSCDWLSEDIDAYLVSMTWWNDASGNSVQNLRVGEYYLGWCVGYKKLEDDEEAKWHPIYVIKNCEYRKVSRIIKDDSEEAADDDYKMVIYASGSETFGPGSTVVKAKDVTSELDGMIYATHQPDSGLYEILPTPKYLCESTRLDGPFDISTTADYIPFEDTLGLSDFVEIDGGKLKLKPGALDGRYLVLLEFSVSRKIEDPPAAWNPLTIANVEFDATQRATLNSLFNQLYPSGYGLGGALCIASITPSPSLNTVQQTILGNNGADAGSRIWHSMHIHNVVDLIVGQSVGGFVGIQIAGGGSTIPDAAQGIDAKLTIVYIGPTP